MKKLSQIVALVSGLGASTVSAQENPEKIADIIDAAMNAATFTNTSLESTAYNPVVQNFREQALENGSFDELEEKGASCSSPLGIGMQNLGMGGLMLTIGTDTTYRAGLAVLRNKLDLAESCAKLAVITYQDPAIREEFIQSQIGKPIYGHRTGYSDWGLMEIWDRSDAEKAHAEQIIRFEQDAERAHAYKVELGPYLQRMFSKPQNGNAPEIGKP